MDTNVWKDLSGNKNDFTLYNYTNALDSTWLNNSIKFNGTNTYIKGINPIYREAEMTIEIVSSRIDNTNGSVISFNIEPDVKTYMSIYTTNQPQKAYEIGFSVSNNVSGVTNHSITKSFLDTEYKINEPKTIAYGKSKYEYFSCLNGENIHKESITNELGFLNNDMYLGCSSKQNNFFKGNIYSIRIYNRVLTDTEIKYNSNIDKLRFGI